MDVSIIISTYGERHWAELAERRALQSAWEQGAYEVLKAHHTTGPVALARNLLATAAEGDWLLFLDADDELAPGYLDAMRRAFEQEGAKALTTALLLTPAVSYLRKARHSTKWIADKPQFNDRGIPLSKDNWLVVGTLIQRDLFDAVGGFSDYPHGFEDFSLWNKAWQLGAEIVKVPDAIYKAYVNPRSAHRMGWRDRKWQVATHERVVDELAKWGRFWTKVEFTSSCWLWTAAKNADGYGCVGVGGGKTDLAHRVAWRDRRGEISDGMYVLHRCDTPACVNPEHLFLGTQADNVADCAKKGRRNQVRYRKLGPKEREEIKALYATGDYSLAELGRRFGVTYQSIRNHV